MATDELTQMKLDINDLKKDVATINEKVDELHADLKEFIKASQSTFAGKWTEKVLIFVMSAVAVSVIGAIMALVLINPQ